MDRAEDYLALDILEYIHRELLRASSGIIIPA